MTTETKDELLGRLSLMEQMVQDGRSSTTYNGWMFLLWGTGYVVAISWVYFLPHANLAWPVIMTLTALIGALVGAAKAKGQPNTTKSRALAGIWIALGCSIFIFALGGSFSHAWAAPQVMLAGIEILIGLANAASSITLKWKTQFVIAIVWWTCGIASFNVGDTLLLPILLAGTLIGNFGFGAYLMTLEARDKRRLAHA
ncbi:MAG: hypothetical protein ACYCSN_15770 [Acidobacteriaceae bacterium]